MKYGIISYRRKGIINIGDDIQLVAIKKIYSRMGIDFDDVIKIDFYDLNSYEGEQVILPICFPLFGYWDGEHITCFSKDITPIFLSLSILDDNLCQDDIDYLRKYAPIGCRDYYTYNNLKKQGVEAYLNGCITLTLSQENAQKNVNSNIICVDLYDEVKELIPPNMIDDCIFKSHIYNNSVEDTMQLAEDVIDGYCENAKLVVTSRMHCAVPCIALGIPVIFVNYQFSYRFSWLENLIHVYTKDEFEKIKWNPCQINCETLKNNMLRLAMERLENPILFNKSWIRDLSTFYNERIERNYTIESMQMFIEFMQRNYCHEDSFEYAIWGVIQHSSLLIRYITDNFPHAHLVAIIDSYKKIRFWGMETIQITQLQNVREILVLVAASAASVSANEYFHEINKDNNTYCIWSTKGIM